MNIYQQTKISLLLNCIGSATLFGSVFLYKMQVVGKEIMLVYLLYLIILFISGLYRKDEKVLKSWAYALMGQLYVALPFSLLSIISLTEVSFFGIEIVQNTEYSPFLLLALFVFIWVNDTGAYLVGSQIGKNRLFERISPKKSWEGFIGGITLAMLFGYLSSFVLTDDAEFQCVGMGLVVSVLAKWGDLSESLMKRTIGVKDSGDFLPGHGGILDRFDSVLLAAPAFLIYLTLLDL